MINRTYLIIEFLLLFVVFPVVLYLLRLSIAHKVVVLLVVVAGGCTLYLVRDKGFARITFLRTAGLFGQLKRILLTFFLPAVVMAVLAGYLMGDRFLYLPKAHPVIWLLMLILYPLLAAYPQEIIFRGFFFHRYRPLFPRQAVMVLVSSLCFGWAHLMYANWVAPLLSGAGGFLFAYRYLRTNSLLAVGIEHGLWGNYLFTIGIGWYFYSGAIQ